MKKVVITGATSFLGAAMVKELLTRKYEVYAVVRRHSKNLYRISNLENVKIIELNLDELEKLDGVLNDADIFMHFAWDGSGSEGRKNAYIQEMNYTYAMNAVKVAKRLGCKVFVFPGSQAEYGKRYDKTEETMLCNPISEYGKNKLRFGIDAENLLKDSDMFFLHLRIYSVYGENDRPGTLVESCIKVFQEGGFLELGDCSQLWNYLYVDDFSNIVLSLIERQFNIGDLENIYNVGGPETKPLREFVKDIYKMTDKVGTYKFGVRDENAEGSPSLVPNLDRLKSMVDLSKLTYFENGVEKMIEKKYGKRCIVCGQRLGSDPLISFDKMPASAQNIPVLENLNEDYAIQLNLYQCDGCGLVQFDCEPVNYYKDVIRSGGYSTTMVELRRKQYKHLIEKYDLVGKDIIEIGCGQGEFLNVLTEFPVNSYGIEHKPDLVELAREKGLNVHQGFITDQCIKNECKKYDAFLSFNFLEHQPDPNKMLHAIYNILNEDGIGLITVPSFEYILKYDGYYELIRDHIAYFTFQSLRVLVEKNGFDILEEEIINRDTLSIIVKKRKKFNLEHWKSSMVSLKKEFEEFIQECKSIGKRIAVWGASHQGFTIIASLEIGASLECIIDSAPFKQGKYSPASHVKIVSPKEFYENPTDVVIIIAPGYTDEIKSNIQNMCGNKVEIYTLRSDHIEPLR